jgi:hypothetical protein
MSEQIDFTREEYELAKVTLERSDVPAGALALLSDWIEGEGLLVDDREDVGGIVYARMDAMIMRTPPTRSLSRSSRHGSGRWRRSPSCTARNSAARTPTRRGNARKERQRACQSSVP